MVLAMKDKIVGIVLAIVIFVFVSGLLYMAIKYPRAYPGYELQPPPIYSPYPLT
mgnify:CR=1 FL=1